MLYANYTAIKKRKKKKKRNQITLKKRRFKKAQYIKYFWAPPMFLIGDKFFIAIIAPVLTTTL